MNRNSNAFSRVLFRLLDFFAPSCCINCGKNIKYEDAYLCGKCLSEIRFISGQSDSSSADLKDNYCATDSDRQFYVRKNITIADYSGVMKEILHHYKFNKVRRLYKHLTELAYNEIEQFQDITEIVTSVPVNRIKKWRRGFNQSELIAKAVAKRLNKKYATLLKDRYKFETQKKLNYRDRFLNIINRYKIISDKHIKNRNILIIDDIFTTGATLNECARILMSAGANNVYSLTIARADIKRLDNL
ncbi:MAG: ComF family protein [Spirochaetes bacterium]|nr:ComF family protein [Spirochaetota bacterium]